MEKNKIPTAEELLLEEIKKFSSPLTSESLQVLVINVGNQHAKNHVQAALKAASENVKHETYEFDGKQPAIDKESILNAYPLDLIK
jgi:hypothetical protein